MPLSNGINTKLNHKPKTKTMRNLLFKKTLPILFLLCLLSISGTMAQTSELVIIDANYTLKQEVLENLSRDFKVLQIDATENPWKNVREFLEQNSSIRSIHLFVNATPTSFELGTKVYDSNTVEGEFEFAMLEGLYQGTHLELLIYDCQIGSNQAGLSLLKTISDKSYVNIAIPTNCNTAFDNDLQFDHTTMNQAVKNSIFN